MFKLNPAPEFTAPALLSAYGEDARQEVQVRWKHKSESALRAWLQKGLTGPGKADFFEEVIVDITGLVDAENQPVTYSRKVLEQLLDDFHHAGSELVDAYIEALQGKRRKNS